MDNISQLEDQHTDNLFQIKFLQFERWRLHLKTFSFQIHKLHQHAFPTCHVCKLEKYDFSWLL